MMKDKKTKAKAEAARRAKAKRAITIRNRRKKQTMIGFREEVAMQIHLKQALEMKRAETREIVEDIARSEDQLRQVHRLEDELWTSLRISVSKKSSIEAQLEEAEAEKGDVFQEIEAMRRERGLLRQRIDGLRTGQGSCCYHRQLAADRVAEPNCNSCKGVVRNTTDVAVQFKKAYGGQSKEELQAQQPSRRSEAFLIANIQETQKMTDEKKTEEETQIRFMEEEEETEIRFMEEVAMRKHQKKELEMKRAEMREIVEDVARSEDQLRQVRRLEDELRTSLQTSVSKKSNIEAQLEEAVTERDEVLREIEAIRTERDLLRQRIDWSRTGHCSCCYMLLMSNQVAETMEHWWINAIAGGVVCDEVCFTDNGIVFRGIVHRTDVAVQFKKVYGAQSKEEFQAQMELLCQPRHPHLVAILGACIDKRWVMSEYMHNRSLLDVLSSKPDLLPWQDRIRIAGEICLAVAFLHASQPKPTVHGNLKATNVLLDQNLVAKLSDLRVNHGHCRPEPEVGDDIKNLGLLLLLLVTGSEKAQARDDVRKAMEGGDFSQVLDRTAGHWPLDIAEEFVRIGLRYSTEENGDDYTGGRTASTLMGEVEGLKTRAKEITAEKTDRNIEEVACTEKKSGVSNIYLCPILQVVMKQPHVAADGFSYELEAIQEWFDCGNETSPVTNLKLEHKRLTPNIVLRSLIADNWHNKNPRSS